MNLDRKLSAYAAGALAACFAGADAADAAVIFDNTPRPFGIDGTVDLNFDGVGPNEFSIGQERTDANTNTDRVILKAPDNGTLASQGYVVGDNGLPAVIPAGTLIGTPEQVFDARFLNNAGNQLVDEDNNDDGTRDDALVGNFTADNIVGNPQFVGVQFSLTEGGPIHYGYIGIDITNADDLTGVVTGFGFEDTPETPIAAGAIPEPSTGLALLAIGAAGLLRRKRS